MTDTAIAAPTVMNGDPAVRDVRRAAYLYTELRPKGHRLGVQMPSGGSVHQADGSIVQVPPGGWVIERADGGVDVLSKEIVAAEFEPVGELTIEDREALPESVRAKEDAVTEALTPQPVPNPPELDPSAVPGANREFEQTDPDDPSKPLTAQRKAELAAQFREKAERSAAELAEAAGKAQAAGLITEHEAAAWRNTGVAPERVNVARDLDGQLVVSRVPAEPLNATAGDESAVDEGALEVPPELDEHGVPIEEPDEDEALGGVESELDPKPPTEPTGPEQTPTPMAFDEQLGQPDNAVEEGTPGQ